MNPVSLVFRPDASSQQGTITAPSNNHSSKASSSLKRHQKINNFFDKLEKADGRCTDEEVSLSCYYLINELQNNERQLGEAARAGDTSRKKELKQKQKILAEQLAELTPQGLHGLSNDKEERLWRRRQQWKSAAIEGFHTWSARACTSTSGIAGAEVSGAGNKAAVHQSFGYLPQAILSGLLRIVTERLQIRVNQAGKPKMAPNLAITSDFKTNNVQLKEVRERLLDAAKTLEQALKKITDESAVTDEVQQALGQELEKMLQAVASGDVHARMDENLWIQLKQDFKSKQFSAVVSVITGAASFAALAIDQSGTGTVAAHKLLCLLGTLLQMPASFFDYLEGSIDLPEERSAQKLDPALLLKPESRHKKPEEVGPEDIDTKIALQLYDEQPQLVRQVVRAISLHAIGKLNSKKLELQNEIENQQMRERSSTGNPMHRQQNSAGHVWRRDKEKALRDTESQLNELMTQHNLFEQHQRYQIDPDGLIGRALVDPLFFWRKGASEGIFNQMGAAMGQVNQRINTNWNPLGIGFASVGVDVANADAGDHYVQDAHHSIGGDGPKDIGAERALVGTATATAVGAVNNGLMNGPARFGKGTFDRKELGMPPQIGKGENIVAESRLEKIDQAVDKGLLSKRQRKSLSQAAAMLDAIEGPASSALSLAPKDILRMQKRWKKFEELCSFETNWRFPQEDKDGNALLDHDGKTIVIDARSTSAAYFRYIPVRRRARLLATDIPKSMWNSMRFWKDISSSGLRGHQWSKLVDGETIVADDLKQLEDRTKSLLERLELRQVEGQTVAPNGEGGDEGNFALDFAQELNTLARLPKWDSAAAGPSTSTSSDNLPEQKTRDQITHLHACLNSFQGDDLAAISPERRDALREDLQTLATRLLDLCGGLSPQEEGSGFVPSAARKGWYVKEFMRTLDESLSRIQELQRALSV